ncbi:MAG: hypothetical protein IKK08_00875 [Clostridia bacterium]|nr:hypothetical protein [Clostridia bacterium]
MPRTLREHPLGFLHSLGWIAAGAAMLYVMHYEEYGYGYAEYADAAVILFVGGCALVLLTMLMGLILKLVNRKPYAAKRERSFLKAAAKRFESVQPGFGKYYACVCAAVFLPLFGVFSVIWLDAYMPGIFLICIGLTVWLCFVAAAMPEARLLKVYPGDEDFDLRREVGGSGIERLLSEQTFGMPEALWEGRREYLYNMLLRAEGITDREQITAYRFSPAAAGKQLGLKNQELPDEPAVWVPLGDYPGIVANGGYPAIRSLFPLSLAAIHGLRYRGNRSRQLSDYPYSSSDIRLVPDETAVLAEAEDGLLLFADSATLPQEEELYHGCMLHIAGARAEGVKWDHFEDLSPDPEKEESLNAKEMQTFMQLLLEGILDYEITHMECREDEKLLAIELWTEPPEGRQDSRIAPFVMDDGLGYLLLLHYETLIWHWMETT